MSIRAAVAVTAAWVLSLASSVAVLAATPTPGAGGDPRSSGQGPGLVGDPAFAIVAVVAIGLIATLGTLAWVKLTGGPRS